MSRAGLVSTLALFFTLCISLSASAPVPERLSSLLERYDDYDNEFVARSLAILLDREFDIAADPEYAEHEYLSIRDDPDYFDEYIKREYDDLATLEERELDEIEYSTRDDSDLDTLRRRSFWSNIGNAFKKVGNAIKGGFQKVGNAVKSGFQKVGNAVKSGFQKAGNAVKSGFQKAGNAMRSGFQKAGNTMRSGFQKVGGAIKGGFQKVGGAIRSGFQKVNQGFKKVGGAIKSGFQRVGQGFRKMGGAIKSGFQKVGQGFRKVGGALKAGFGKVGKFFKEKGAVIGKFALKMVAAGTSVASKLVKFIPGVGTLASKALQGIAMGTNMASDKIHANLGGKLGEVAQGLDYVISPEKALDKFALKGKGGQALSAVESIFL